MTQFHFTGIFIRIINKSFISEYQLCSHALMELLTGSQFPRIVPIRVNDPRQNHEAHGQ